MPGMWEIEEFVAEVERKTARAREEARRRPRTRFVQNVGYDLGRVTVADGELVEITLNRAKLRYTNGAILAREIILAVRRAEEIAHKGETGK
jgi:hypothetical protein